MKSSTIKISSIVGISTLVSTIVAASFWFAALAGEVHSNTERGLEAEIRYLTNLKAEFEIRYSVPRPPEIQKQIEVWKAEIETHQLELATERDK